MKKKKVKDPLDEIFVEYHKEIIKEKYGQWEFKKIDGKFIQWFNCWGDLMRKEEYKKSSREFREGYSQAIRDIMSKLKIEWRLFDKRTKTGFKK